MLEFAALYEANFCAENYRKFDVGATVLARNKRGELKIFGGANLMTDKGGPKVCAEQQAIKNAFLNGYKDILIVYVVGKPQPDKQSGIKSPTLHPCWDCRILMREMHRLRNDTLILTRTLNKKGPKELHTLRGLIEYHSTPRPRSWILFCGKNHLSDSIEQLLRIVQCQPPRDIPTFLRMWECWMLPAAPDRDPRNPQNLLGMHNYRFG